MPARPSKIIVLFLLLLLATAGLASPAAALAAPVESPFAPLAEPDVPGPELRKRFEAGLPRIVSDSRWATFEGGILLCEEGDDDGRRLRAKGILELLERAKEVLDGMGLPVKGSVPEFTVVRVEVPTGSGGSVSLGAKALLIRIAGRSDAVAPPVLPPRIDGPPLERDLTGARAGFRRWLAAAGSSGAGGSPAAALGAFVAARAVDAAVPAGTPAWFRAGLADVAAARLEEGSPPPPPPHLPARLASLPKEALATLLAGEDADPAAGPIFRGMVESLLAKKGDPGALAAALAGARTLADQSAAVGTDLVEEAATAAKAWAETADRCGEGGTVDCPVCAGKGKVEMACPSCEGTGSLSCPSCLGLSACWAGNCDRGFQEYVGGKRVRCKYCNGGKTSCKACRGQLRIDCTACRGRGKETRTCLACVGEGRLTCPSCAAAGGRGVACSLCGGGGSHPCPWCAKADTSTCGGCGGPGFQGCRACFGTLRWLCGGCEGTGERRMVYEDGTVASASKCPDCNGRGWSPCSRCKNGRRVCADCSGKGILKKPPSSCPACGGSRKLSCAACGPAPDAGPAAADATSGGTAEDSEANAVVLRNALSFLLGCGRTPSGAFALRDRSKGTTAGALRKPSHYSNSQVAWTLLVAGIAPDNPGMARAMKVLEEEGRMIADGRIPDAGVQATAFTLRALLVGGRGPGDPLVEKLADRLVEAQRPSGLWNYALDGTGGDDNILDSLIAVEALHVARTRGLRISRSVWSKAFRAASSEFGSRGPAGARRGDLSAIDVVSNLALLVIAKAGSLGDEAGTFDYHSLPDVRAGLAWLDRHFSIVDHPDFRAGARLHPDGGGAYFAHLFALQRLAMLLSIDELGGQRWHVTGSRHIRGLQRQDGSFEERGPAAANWSVRSSCFAVLFLLRATTPITQQGEAK